MTGPKVGKNIVDTERYKYARVATERTDGSTIRSKDNGDPVAVALRGKTPDDLVVVLEENGMLDDRYRGYHTSMSPGRFRMTVGQALRYRWKRGEVTKIDGNVLAVPEGVTVKENGKPVEQAFDPAS